MLDVDGLDVVPMVSTGTALRLMRQRDEAIARAQRALLAGDDPVDALIRISLIDQTP